MDSIKQRGTELEDADFYNIEGKLKSFNIHPATRKLLIYVRNRWCRFLCPLDVTKDAQTQMLKQGSNGNKKYGHWMSDLIIGILEAEYGDFMFEAKMYLIYSIFLFLKIIFLIFLYCFWCQSFNFTNILIAYKSRLSKFVLMSFIIVSKSV